MQEQTTGAPEKAAPFYQLKAEALDVALYGKPSIYDAPELFVPRREAIAGQLALLFPLASDFHTAVVRAVLRDVHAAMLDRAAGFGPETLKAIAAKHGVEL